MLNARILSTFHCLLLVLVVPISLASCRDESATAYYPKELVAAPLDEPTLWQTCAWDSTAGDRLAECALVTVPLDYDVPSGEHMQLLVKRRKATVAPIAQLWLVHGGPGASATTGMVDLSFGIPELRSDITYYAVDHRGVGGSERLGCPQQEAVNSPGGKLVIGNEWFNCLAAVKTAQRHRLDAFTTSDSAIDLAQLINKYRKPTVPVFVYGGSYGTYLVRRYLSIASENPDGVILEGTVAVDGGMTGYDAQLEKGALRLLAACDAAEECARHFDTALRVQTDIMLVELEDGHCGTLNLEPDVARQLLAAMTFYADTRVLVPPLVFRIRRCQWRDVLFIAKLVRNFSALIETGSYSPVLHHHVVLSEMYRPGLPASELQAQFERATLSTGMEVVYAALYDQWPKYTVQPFGRQTQTYDGPMLMLHGDLDVPAPVSRVQNALMSLAGGSQIPVQSLVVFPQGAHGVIDATPTIEGTDCGLQMVLAFIENPRIRPNDSCVSEILPLDWKTFPEAARILAGTSNIWAD